MSRNRKLRQLRATEEKLRVEVKRVVSTRSDRSRYITLIGAVIVFATFIIKDALKERAKEWSDSVASAQADYDRIEHQDAMLNRLDALGKQAEIVAAYVHSHSSPSELGEQKQSPQREKFAQLFSDKEEPVIDFQQLLDNLSHLLDKLGRTPEEIARSRYLQQRVKYINEQTWLSDRQTSISPAEKSKIVEPMAFVTYTGQTMFEVGMFHESVLARAHAVAEDAKRQYGSYTWASYILYSIGWGLGFLGKFYGVGAFETLG